MEAFDVLGDPVRRRILEHASRTVADGHLHDAAAHVVELRRQLRAPVADVWEACTDPDRVRHWFLPLSGDLRPGAGTRP